VTELLASGRVAELWVPNFMNEEGLLGEAIDTAESAGVPVMRVATGMVRTTRSFRLEVLGPRRKYQAENDGSVILLASAGGTALLGGDIEAVAQSEMPDVMPDVIVVPHHGSGTTDTGWLSEVVGAVAVLSYGRNSYGHPHPDVLDTLERAGTDVHHTYLEGDVSIDLASMRGRQGDLEE
jgi:competence protein ComEC